jgi:hypothetical protein
MLRLFSRSTMQLVIIYTLFPRKASDTPADSIGTGSRLHHTTPDLGLSSETQSDSGIDVDDLPPQVRGRGLVVRDVRCGISVSFLRALLR